MMIPFIKIIITILFSLLFVFICDKKSLFAHNAGEVHQSFIKSKQTPLVGGIIIFFFIMLNFQNLTITYLFPFLILLIGILSDVRKLKSAYLRLFIQFLLVILFIYLYEMNIVSTRIHILDNFLDKNYSSILFTVFCVLILINGTNFIDGSNLIAIGYFIILEFVFIILGGRELNFDSIFFQDNLIYVLLIILSLNFFNKLYLGDGGAYLLGFIYSFKCISLYIFNPNISPFFITLILWYPAFEILFSILRKVNFNRSPIKPDSNHLHQLIYFYLNKKISNQVMRSNTVGILINIFNFVFILFSLMDIYNTQYQIILFVINISVYVFIYTRLLRFKLRSNF